MWWDYFFIADILLRQNENTSLGVLAELQIHKEHFLLFMIIFMGSVAFTLTNSLSEVFCLPGLQMRKRTACLRSQLFSGPLHVARIQGQLCWKQRVSEQGVFSHCMEGKKCFNNNCSYDNCNWCICQPILKIAEPADKIFLNHIH
jgi:hypothetical protein